MNVKGEKKKSSKMYTAFTVDEYLIDSMKKKSAGLSLFFMSSKGMEMHRPEEKKVALTIFRHRLKQQTKHTEKNCFYMHKKRQSFFQRICDSAFFCPISLSNKSKSIFQLMIIRERERVRGPGCVCVLFFLSRRWDSYCFDFLFFQCVVQCGWRSRKTSIEPSRKKICPNSLFLFVGVSLFFVSSCTISIGTRTHQPLKKK